MSNSVHVFLADGTYHNEYRHGETATLLYQEFGGNIPEIYSFSDETGLWSHYCESTSKPGVMRWKRTTYSLIPAEIKAQMILLGLHCATDGESLT